MNEQEVNQKSRLFENFQLKMENVVLEVYSFIMHWLLKFE